MSRPADLNTRVPIQWKPDERPEDEEPEQRLSARTSVHIYLSNCDKRRSFTEEAWTCNTELPSVIWPMGVVLKRRGQFEIWAVKSYAPPPIHTRFRWMTLCVQEEDPCCRQIHRFYCENLKEKCEWLCVTSREWNGRYTWTPGVSIMGCRDSGTWSTSWIMKMSVCITWVSVLQDARWSMLDVWEQGAAKILPSSHLQHGSASDFFCTLLQ